MKKFNVKPLGAIISGLAMAAASQSMMAQTSGSTETDPEVEEIVVTGFARSIQNAIDVKRNADTVVQAISADDIGGLPDISIADALGRVPGITVTREGGQAGRIQVRGMSGDFVSSTLNGREQVSPNGSRAMEYSQFPSELINSVQVYMSPKASLIEGGVSGSVELKTANPLDMTEDLKFNVSARGSYNDQASDIYNAEPFGHRLSVSYQQKFLDDTLGIALGAATLSQSKSTQRFEHYGFTERDLADSTTIVDKNFEEVPLNTSSSRPSTVFMSNGFETFQTGGEDKRDGYTAAVQFTPNETFSAQADVFYSKFDSTGFSRGYRIENPQNADAVSVVLGDNYEVIGAEFQTLDNNPGGFNLQTNFTDKAPTSELLSGGLNLTWNIDNLKLSLDVSHSDASGYNDDKNVEIHQYVDSDTSDSGYARDPNQGVTFLLDGINIPSVSLSRVPQNSYGHWYNEEGVSNWRMTKYGHYPRINDDVLDAVRFDGKLELEGAFFSSLESGYRWSKRNHTEERKVFVYGDNIRGLDDYPLEINTENSDIVRWKGDFAGLPSFLAVDADKIIRDAYNAGLVTILPDPTVENPNPVAVPRSIKPVARWDEGKSWSMEQRADIDEEVNAFYLQTNIATTLFGNDLTGNIGVRYVHTDQSSVGLVNVNGDTDRGAVPIYDDIGNVRSEFAYQRLGTKFSNTLPTINLNYSVTDADQIRFALARVMGRAPINRLASARNQGSVTVGTDDIPVYNYGTGTSPYLKPFIADQVDVSFEHYMEDTNGTVTLGMYHREIKSFIQDITYQDFDFRGAGFDIPDTWIVDIDGVDTEVEVENGDYTTAVNNVDGGYIRGAELIYTQTFNFLPDLWSGLGVSGNISLADSEITAPNTSNSQAVTGSTMPYLGLVERSANITIFYSYESFETRVSTNFQDEFVGEVRNIELNPVYFAPEIVVDYQASYKFDNGLDAVFSVGNVTNEPNRSYIEQEKYTRVLQWFGRTYNLGVNYTF